MRKVELPEAVLDLLKEVAPNALLRIARGDGADAVLDEVAGGSLEGGAVGPEGVLGGVPLTLTH